MHFLNWKFWPSLNKRRKIEEFWIRKGFENPFLQGLLKLFL